MFMQTQTNAVEDLFSKTTDYLETKVELLELKAVSKISNIASSFVSGFVMGIVILVFLLFFNIGIAFWLGALFGKTYLGFLAVAGFYLLVFIIVYATRKKIIQLPVKEFIIKHFAINLR